MPRALLVLLFITLNACSVYSGRGIPAPVESREGVEVNREAPPFTGPMQPETQPGQESPQSGSSARTFPARSGVPQIDDVTPASTSGSRPTVPPPTEDVPPARSEGRPAQPVYTEPQNSGSPTAALLVSAEAAIAEGDFERAAALTERALRISPRDGYLWYRLADIRYQQERYTDAAGFAQRARSFAGSNRQLTGAIDDLLERTADARR